MLSQRIILLADRQNRLPSEETAVLLDQSVRLFQDSHRRLSAGVGVPTLGDNAAYIESLYSTAEFGLTLEQRVDLLTAVAKEVLAGTDLSQTLLDWETSGFDRKILRQLDNLVQAYEVIARQETDRLGQISFLSALAAIAILVLEAIFIFYPADRWIRRAVAQLAKERSDAEAHKEKAEDALAIKSKFLSNMSHEIRTPLNGILGSLQLVSEDQLSARNKELIDAVFLSSKHLLHLVNSILDVSKIEAGKFELVRTTFAPMRCCRSVALLMEPLAQQKGLSFKTDLQLEKDLWLHLDQTRLTQLLTNLIHNAIKFTSSGSVTLHARYVSDQNPALYLSVIDTGPGISDTDQARIFDGFAQIENEQSVSTGGTGLGLTICKEIVDKMGGQIWVESDLGHGASFHVTIPAEPVGAPAGETQVDDDPALGELTILLAEDVKINQIIAQRMLTEMGHMVDCVFDGEEALRALSDKPEEHYDLLILDNRMPNKSGLDVLKAVRSDGTERKHIPVLIMSADVLELEQNLFKAAGANGFVPKPVDQKHLRTEISRVMLGHKKPTT